MRSRESRWLFFLVLLAGLAGFAALWYGADQADEAAKPAFGGSYVEGVAGAPGRLNPLFAGQNDVDEALVALVFAGLTRLDDQGRAFPDLAESWSVSPDGLTYTLPLRPGLVWHDGAPLTAEDVVFTYGLLKAPGLRPSPARSAALGDAAVSRLDDRTVRIQLIRPFAPLPSFLTLGILPAHILGNTSPSALVDAAFNRRPVGAGPYKLEELTAERAVLAANPAHHRGQPFIQRLELRFYRDKGLLLAAIKSKQVEGGLLSAGVAPADRQQLEQRSDLRLTMLPTGETTYIHLNLGLPLFQDRRLRHALLLALDRDAIVTEIFDGQVLRADSPLGPGSWAYSDALKLYDPDLAGAAALLGQAGYLPGADGVRTRNGVPLAFTLAVNNDPVRVAVASQIAAAWSKIGVRVTVEASGATDIVRDLLEPRSFQALLFAHVTQEDPDPYLFWHSSQISPKGANFGSFRNERVDRILEEARQLATPTRRHELYAEFQELFVQELPALPLYVSTEMYVQKAALQGARPGYLDRSGSRFWQAHEWYLKTH